MPASQDLTYSTGEVFLCPAPPIFPRACATVADTALPNPLRSPPESPPLTPSSRWRAATHGRGLTSRLTVVGWQGRLGVITRVPVQSSAARHRDSLSSAWYASRGGHGTAAIGVAGRDEGTVARWSWEKYWD